MVKAKKGATGILENIDMRKVAGGGLLIGAGLLMASELGLFGNGEDGGEGGAQAATQRFGRILGSDGKKVSSEPGASYTYNIAGSAPPSFPAIPSISLESLLKVPEKQEAYKSYSLLASHVQAQSSGNIVVPSMEVMQTTKKLSQAGRVEYAEALRKSVVSGRSGGASPTSTPSKKSASTSAPTRSKGGYARAGSPHLGGWG